MQSEERVEHRWNDSRPVSGIFLTLDDPALGRRDRLPPEWNKSNPIGQLQDAVNADEKNCR
jgi:hypothetical protein